MYKHDLGINIQLPNMDRREECQWINQWQPWWVCSTFEETDDVTQAWSKMYDSIVEEHVKTRKAKICKDSLPWVDGQMRKLMNKRYKLLKQCDGTEKTSAQWTEYRKVKNKVTKMMRQAESKYWHDQFSEAASTQDFWKTYRKATKKTINTRIGPLTSKDGKEITDD